ncbi:MULTISPECIES: hypothetical protein [Streptacidiphilus]|uniref:Uncharacterized protein n=1 Tax=Streptacidiphilus cavernicola TaxID=3342716 RepID=A0ABV6UP66_9ACTN|nr:hypothetical protein [Streptacidiphilus jeojiense]
MPGAFGKNSQPPDHDVLGTYEFFDPNGLVAVQRIGEHPSCDVAARASADEMERRSGGRLLITAIRRRDQTGWITVPR